MKFAIGGIIVYGMLLIFIGVSWFVNLFALIECDFESPYKAEVVHTVGLLPIASCITAWIDVEDGKE